MKKLLMTIVILLAFGQSSCDLLGIGEDKVCGDKKEGYFYRTSHGTGFFTDDSSKAYLLDRTYYGGEIGTRSTIILEEWVQHVCPDKHVKVKASISADIDADFNVSSKGYWYFFFEQQINLSASNDSFSRTWVGNDEIGLKQAYGDSGEGEFTIQAILDFPYQGSFEADTMYLFNKLQNVTLEAEYYEMK